MESANQILKAVIFDLDDTLYDHLHSARHGLIKLSSRWPEMKTVSVRELEDRYSYALESIHLRLMRGEIDQTEARTIRMQQLFSSFGISVDAQTAFTEYKQFRQDYDSACRVVNGGIDLLHCLRSLELRLAIITNNMVSEQWPKLEQLGIRSFFEVVSISEEIGASKPDRKIFDVTLERLSLNFDEVVMVGDSLESDIAGGLGVGIRSVWLNRRPDKNIQPPAGVVSIASDFSDVEFAVSSIIGRKA